MTQRTFIVTGVAGFIGYHLAQCLIARGDRVIGFDELNNYYSVELKKARLASLGASTAFEFFQVDLADIVAVRAIMQGFRETTHIVHLAAQAGVRYSLKAPSRYVSANVQGHVTMLECARDLENLQNFVYASSSSVYGLNRQLPFRECDAVDQPSSLYAATKRAGELIASTYAHLHGFPITGLRFFTVYGPWGRPDMAYYAFAKAIALGQPVTLYDAPGLSRDFTFIDDIVAGVIAAIDQPGLRGAARLFNLGGDAPTSIAEMLDLLGHAMKKPVRVTKVPLPKTDVVSTWACLDQVQSCLGWRPKTSLSDGIPIFAEWFEKARAAQRYG